MDVAVKLGTLGGNRDVAPMCCGCTKADDRNEFEEGVRGGDSRCNVPASDAIIIFASVLSWQKRCVARQSILAK